MTRRHWTAIVVAFGAMILTLVPPLWVRATGEEVTLDIAPVDPLSLFRGNYVDLRYDVEIPPNAAVDSGSVYAVFDHERPARLVRLTAGRPSLDSGEFCIRGELSGSRVSFPNLEQFFVTPERGREIENDLANMVAVVKVTGGCRAVLVDIEPEF